MPVAGFEHAIPAIKCLQIYALDHTTTESMDVSDYNIFTRNWLIHTQFVYLFMVYIMTLSVAYLQGVSRLEDNTAAGDFLGLSDQESSYKHVSDFGRLRSYGHF
jgi:hypothetical protein